MGYAVWYGQLAGCLVRSGWMLLLLVLPTFTPTDAGRPHQKPETEPEGS